MSMLYIWNPYIVPGEPHIIEFMLTRGAADAVAQGDKQFIKELLSDIGIDVKIATWLIESCRTNYYSEYLDQGDWRGVWQLVWKVRVITTDKINAIPETDLPMIETDATDDSWAFENRIKDASIVTCLVIGDFDNHFNLENAIQLILNDIDLEQMRQKCGVDKPKFSSFNVLKKYEQLQIDLGGFSGEFFANGADYAERVIDLCKQSNGTVKFEDRLE